MKKKHNTRAKGAKHVKEAMEIFESIGFSSWKPGNKAHFIGKGRVVSQSQDILEAFDFIAVRAGSIPFLVQVTSLSDLNNESLAAQRRKKIDKIELGFVEALVMARKPGKKWLCWAKVGDQWSRSGELREEVVWHFILNSENYWRFKDG